MGFPLLNVAPFGHHKSLPRFFRFRVLPIRLIFQESEERALSVCVRAVLVDRLIAMANMFNSNGMGALYT